MISFETELRINRPIEDVFLYVSDPLNFPHWNSAVEAVRKTSGTEHGVSSTYLMERALPTGRAMNGLEVVACDRPQTFAIRTTSGPTPFLYRYRFASENGGTVVRLDAEVEVPGALVHGIARRLVKSGVDHNLVALKVILETPR